MGSDDIALHFGEMAVMRKLIFGVIPALLLSAAIAPAAIADDVTTPLQSAVEVRGNSGGSDSSDCGYIDANQPAQVIHVREDFAALQFTVESAGEPTLLIVGSDNYEQCVMADDLSGGIINVPGVWNRGTYSVFVGDRVGSPHRFTLTIAQE